MVSLIILQYFTRRYTKYSAGVKTFGAAYGLVRLNCVTGP
jgi:hypothetical protein